MPRHPLHRPTRTRCLMIITLKRIDAEEMLVESSFIARVDWMTSGSSLVTLRNGESFIVIHSISRMEEILTDAFRQRSPNYGIKCSTLFIEIHRLRKSGMRRIPEPPQALFFPRARRFTFGQRMKRLFQCLKARAIRRRKARDWRGWRHRWINAVARCRRILDSGPNTRARFLLWQRNHRRLCLLSVAKARSR